MSKKVTISLPDELLAQIDTVADEKLQTRGELICEAIRAFLKESELDKRAGSYTFDNEISEMIERLAKEIRIARKKYNISTSS